MKACRVRAWMLALLAAGLGSAPVVAGGNSEPDAFRIETGNRFRPVAPDDRSRPAWLFATARGLARSAGGTENWVVYELALDRRLPFHHLLMELLIGDKPSQLYIRLLDGEREVVSADWMGNIAERFGSAGNVFVDLPLADQPGVAVVQVLVPAEEEDALRMMSVIPASYEILMKTAGDFVSGARAWVRRPIYDPKNLDLLTDVTLLEDGRLGDMTSPIASFAAYGVDSRSLDDFAFLPDGGDGYRYAGTGFALDAVPVLARFDVAVRNVDPLQPIEVWLNQRRVGALSLAWPDLEDPAYWPAAPSADGWRVGRWVRAWFFIDHEALRLGDNTLVIGQRAGGAGEADVPPLAMYGPRLQFKYPWDEIATYNLLHFSGHGDGESIVNGVDPAPLQTARQEEDIFIVRADRAFQTVGPGSNKPDWLTAIDRERTDDYQRFRIRLHPDRVPHQLSLDVVYRKGRGGRVEVTLLRGEETIKENVFGAQLLDPFYAQSTLPLQIPLKDFGADTVELTVRRMRKYAPSLSRLQLKAAWPGAVLAAGHFESDGSLVETQYDTRSAYIPGEVLLPRRDGEHSAGEEASRWLRHIPLQEEGEWYGVETRVLQQEAVHLGDVRQLYFAEWEITVDEVPLFGRLDFLVQHVNVVESLMVLVNGKEAGGVALYLPGVHDANYMIFRVNRRSEDGTRLTSAQRYAIDYGPYARAALVFDGRLLQPGRNRIAIGKRPRLKGTNDHYSMKEIRLQLKYPWAKDVSAP